MKVLVFDPGEIAAKAAHIVAETVRAAIAARGKACLAFSGGSTPWPMFQALAAETVAWDRVHIFQTDERAVAIDDLARSLPQLQHDLLSHVPIPAGQIHAMPVEAENLTDGARHYAAILEHAAGMPAQLDLVHLGLGDDGHTASLVPGDTALAVSDTDVAVSGPYQGYRRMTLTYPALNRARMLLWLVTGAGKAEILKRLCDGDQTIPAGRVNADRAVVVADRDAARLLSKAALS